MNFKVFSLFAFVMVLFVFKSTSAQMPQMPPMPPMPPVPSMDPGMAPPGMAEGMQTAQGFKDMAMSQIPGADSTGSE